MHSRGFTLIELLIVVAIFGIIAAIGITALINARVAANESATLGDIRTIISAQTAYRSANAGFYDRELSCLTAPSAPPCIPSYPISAPTFLDSVLASEQAKAGYNRSFQGGPFVVPPNPAASSTSTTRYRYDATPTSVGQTGVRGFAADHNGRLCVTADGTPVPAGPIEATLPVDCQDIR